jgi:hypothetical protein
MTTDETCNGYTNWHTFSFDVTVSNDEPLYRMRERWFTRLMRRDVTRITSKLVRDYSTAYGLTRRVKSSDRDIRIGAIDWSDIAESWQSDYDEFLQYHEDHNTGRM